MYPNRNSLSVFYSLILQDTFFKDLEEQSALAAILRNSLEEATKEAAAAAARVPELEVRNK
jgi:hypothetical protein